MDLTLEIPVDDPQVAVLSATGMARLKAGDEIGYILSKKFPVQVWIGATVVANDREDGILAIESARKHAGGCDHDTLLYSSDAVIRWPQS